MPCDSSHMNPTPKEIEQSKVYAFLSELAGRGFDFSWFEGYHPNVYNKHLSQAELDHSTAKLCSKLKRLDDDGAHGKRLISELSLEAQMWWRDHKAHDEKKKKGAVISAQEEYKRALGAVDVAKAKLDKALNENS